MASASDIDTLISLQQDIAKLVGMYGSSAIHKLVDLAAGGVGVGNGKKRGRPAKATMAAKPAKAKGKPSPNAGIKPCRVPGCGKPSKGPRFGFLCETHREMNKADIAKLLASATPGPGTAGKAPRKRAAAKKK